MTISPDLKTTKKPNMDLIYESHKLSSANGLIKMSNENIF